MKIRANGNVYALRMAYRPPRRWLYRPALPHDLGRAMGRDLARGIRNGIDEIQVAAHALVHATMEARHE